MSRVLIYSIAYLNKFYISRRINNNSSKSDDGGPTEN